MLFTTCGQHDYVLKLDQDFYSHPQAIYRIEMTRTRPNRSSITIFQSRLFGKRDTIGLLLRDTLLYLYEIFIITVVIRIIHVILPSIKSLRKKHIIDLFLDNINHRETINYKIESFVTTADYVRNDGTDSTSSTL